MCVRSENCSWIRHWNRFLKSMKSPHTFNIFLFILFISSDIGLGQVAAWWWHHALSRPSLSQHFFPAFGSYTSHSSKRSLRCSLLWCGCWGLIYISVGVEHWFLFSVFDQLCISPLTAFQHKEVASVTDLGSSPDLYTVGVLKCFKRCFLS